MRTLSFLFILLMITPLFAVELFESPMNEKNKQDIEMIFSEISTHLLVKSGFSQGKTISRLNRTIKSSGNMLFDSSMGIAWQILKPFPSTMILTDNAMIQKSPGGQVRTMSAEGNETFHRFSKTIQSVFLGQIELIMNEYELYYNKGNTGQWEIGLIPKDSALKSIVKAFEIHGEDFIEVFKIYESNGDEILYEFQNINFPEQLTQEEKHVFE